MGQIIEKEINGYPHIIYQHPQQENNSVDLSAEYLCRTKSRRSIREFSNKEVPREVIENIIKTAATSPSGANKQPWIFCAVSSPEIKSKIKAAAEKEEKINYDQRMSEEWKQDLEPLATTWQKPYLEKAPWLIIVFKQIFTYSSSGEKRNHYYVNESVGIACGLLISAIHHAGLVTLTHTPSPMNFLSEILDRPDNERPYLLLPVGFPENSIYVPKIQKKPFQEVAQFY